MSTVSVCEKCGGTGWIIRERANLSGAEPCGCRSLGREQRLADRSQIPENFRNASFDNYKIASPENPVARRELTAFWLAVKEFARTFPTGPKLGLLLIGETGIGKTHLAVAALREIIARGHEGVYYNYVTLLHNIKEGYSEVSNTSDRAAYKLALESEVLLIDDLGAHRVSEWTEDTINSIVTYRCDKKKPLIATTNCPDPDSKHLRAIGKNESGERDVRPTLAEVIGPRARSRLFEMCTVVNAPRVEDYRVHGGNKF